MDFILSTKNPTFYRNSLQLGDYYINYEENNRIRERELIYNTNELILLTDANNSFINNFLKNPSFSSIEENISSLKNGYILVFNKKSNTLIIYTDVFGFYQLFYINRNSEIYVSSDFKNLLFFSDKNLDEYAIIDLLLFNYTLMDRTLISDIKRLKGGTKLVFKNNGFSKSTINNFADNFYKKPESYKAKPVHFSEILIESLNTDLIKSHKTYLTMTAGFDSRFLLALVKNMNIDILTFTFGQTGNIEQEIISKFINDYSANHSFFVLDKAYISSLPKIMNDYLLLNLDNPVLLDLPHYLYIKDQIIPSNLITGFMGGEIISGQTVDSQVTFTDSAAKLLLCRDLSDAQTIIISQLGDLDYINIEYVKHISGKYIESLSNYFYKKNKSNILSFLVNEKYSKFFGSVNKIYKNYCNLITPYMDPGYISYILNSRISFLNKNPFTKNPFVNVKSKILYAKTIKYLYPSLSETKFDRLYSIDDLCYNHKLPKTAYRYFQNHYFNKNKKMYPKPHNYDLWYGDFIIKNFQSEYSRSKTMLFNNKFNFTTEQYTALSAKSKKKAANAAGALQCASLINEL